MYKCICLYVTIGLKLHSSFPHFHLTKHFPELCCFILQQIIFLYKLNILCENICTCTGNQIHTVNLAQVESVGTEEIAST